MSNIRHAARPCRDRPRLDQRKIDDNQTLMCPGPYHVVRLHVHVQNPCDHVQEMQCDPCLLHDLMCLRHRKPSTMTSRSLGHVFPQATTFGDGEDDPRKRGRSCKVHELEEMGRTCRAMESCTRDLPVCSDFPRALHCILEHLRCQDMPSGVCDSEHLPIGALAEGRNTLHQCVDPKFNSMGIG